MIQVQVPKYIHTYMRRMSDKKQININFFFGKFPARARNEVRHGAYGGRIRYMTLESSTCAARRDATAGFWTGPDWTGLYSGNIVLRYAIVCGNF